MECAHSKEAEDEKSQPDRHQTPLLSFPGHDDDSRAEGEDRGELDGKPGVGFGQDQVDHSPSPIDMVKAFR